MSDKAVKISNEDYKIARMVVRELMARNVISVESELSECLIALEIMVELGVMDAIDKAKGEG